MSIAIDTSKHPIQIGLTKNEARHLLMLLLDNKFYYTTNDGPAEAGNSILNLIENLTGALY